jgi:DNA primase
MAKTYLEIVKYMVESEFTIDGMVDKPDIIGAVFGQTEGLLGNELDLRELQKNGKIGRIEIELQPQGNRTHGKLYLPASLDRIETCILAAAVEAVDRVGPYEAQFAIKKVEDTRSEKRRKILARAKDLVRILLNTEIPDSREIAELVQSDVRASEIASYGPENLPAGPDVGKSDEVIIVEGRADVLNLLRNDITNAVAVGGATNNIPKTIIDLCNQKEATIFADGDRGGDLIIRSLMNAAEIDYVTKAPDGKEVEDLTRKEIIKSLRAKTPVDQAASDELRRQRQGQSYQRTQQPAQARPMPSNSSGIKPPSQLKEPSRESTLKPAPSIIKSISSEDDKGIPAIEPQSLKEGSASPAAQPALQSVILTQLSSGLDELSGTLRSRIYDPAGNVVKEVPIRELLVEVQDSEGAYAIVLDGVITQRLVELALQKGIKAIYGNRANPFQKKEKDIILYTKEQGVL